MKPFRIALDNFPDVVLHAEELTVKRHLHYPAAKSGSIGAARALVMQFINLPSIQDLKRLLHEYDAEVLPVQALEAEGVNEIPVALADELSRQLDLIVNRTVVQTNSVGQREPMAFIDLPIKPALLVK